MKREGDLRKVLAMVFLVALLAGPGPGAALVGGSAEEPRFLFGVPLLYLWLVLWLVVMAGCVVVAARKLWREED